MTAYQLIFRHDAGQTVILDYLLYDNRLLIFTSEDPIPSEDPNNVPITFVR